MVNIKKAVKGQILHLEINLTERYGETGLGKGNIVASTQGWDEIEGFPAIGFNLNVIESKRKAARLSTQGK